jgi:hypothetical protein
LGHLPAAETKVSLAADEDLVAIETGGRGPGTVSDVDPEGAVWFSAEFYGNAAADDESFLLHFDGQVWTSYPIGGVADATLEPDGTAPVPTTSAP